MPIIGHGVGVGALQHLERAQGGIAGGSRELTWCSGLALQHALKVVEQALEQQRLHTREVPLGEGCLHVLLARHHGRLVGGQRCELVREGSVAFRHLAERPVKVRCGYLRLFQEGQQTLERRHGHAEFSGQLCQRLGG